MASYLLRPPSLHRALLLGNHSFITNVPVRRRYSPRPCASAERSDSVKKIKGITDDMEDRSVAHLAFLSAHQMSQPEDMRIAGMQDFAAAILERRRRIPSTLSSGDPLMRIFDEFDKDRDGHLNAKELSAALRSRKVEISEEQVQEFIEVSDVNSNHTVEKDEFRAFLEHMASVDLRNRQMAQAQVSSSSSESESEEEEAEADERLQAVLTHSLDVLHSHDREQFEP